MPQTLEGKHIDSLVVEMLDRIDRFDDIIGVKEAKKLGHELHMQSQYNGNVVPLDVFNAAKTSIVISPISYQHFSDVYRAVDGSSNEAVEKVMGLVSEYELIHYLRVHLQRSAQIEQRDYTRSYEEDAVHRDPFYRDNPGFPIRDLSDEDKEEKREAIGRIRALYGLECAYINTISPVIYGSRAWKDPVTKYVGEFKDEYFKNLSKRRQRLLENLSELDTALLEQIKFFSRI